MYDGRNASSSPFEQSVYLLAEAGRAVDRLLAARLDVRGLTPVHHTLLSVLAQLGPHGRHDLTSRVSAPGPEADQALDDLLSARLLQSMVVHVGGRQEVLAITAPGRAALEVLHGDASAVQEDLLTSLTKGQRAELNSLLRRVCAAAARAAERPAQPQGAGNGWVLTAGGRRTWAPVGGTAGVGGSAGVAGEADTAPGHRTSARP
ncbi:MarR family winged helix-turn-helix transcriptional regulator [Kitasatospora sp. NPDC058115]|uniref:MarR family winged helix-turn-helix transcriptional regulator n=1 Tax=Kitasatospora sp. NPDC058115 TaxID=3346347 RepID=UPI0036DD7897